MPFDSDDLIRLSRLLDEALALEPAELAPWMDGLDPAHQALRPQLLEMLARRHSATQEGFLAEGPRLDGEADEPTGQSAGERVGPYVLIRELGHGGMGRVWLAERADGTLTRRVALKLPRIAWGVGLAQRMARERDIVARLEHPNIARLYDAGLDDQGRPYLALEFIDGQPIDAYCEARALPLCERLGLVVQVAHAVGYAHARLVVHRDLKPSNILVTPDGTAHLLDFGIAKLLETSDGADGEHTQTMTQGRLLTPRYASPEQAAGRSVTVASDVYSLGVVLYQLLAGQLPATPALGDDSTPASRSARDPAVVRALRGDLDAIIGKALKNDPARRYTTMEAFALDIESHLAGRPVQARPDSRLHAAGRFARRHWLGLSATAAVCVATAAGGATAIVQARHAARDAERARAATEFVSELFRLNVGGAVTSSGTALPTDFIDRGASLIRARFAEQPEMQAELLGAVGRTYDEMGADALAADYASQRLQVLQSLPDTRKQQVDCLLLASSAALHGEDAEAAEASAQRALVVAGEDPELRVDSLAALARAAVEGGHLVQAEQDIKNAEVILRAAGNLDEAACMARLLAAKAMWLAAVDRIPESKPVSQIATRLALRNEGPGSRTAEDLRFRQAMHLLIIGESAEAQAAFEQSIAIVRQRGGRFAKAREASNTASFVSVRWVVGAITFEEALKQELACRDIVSGLGSALPPIIRAKVDLAVATLYMRLADVSKAKEWIDRSAPVILAAKPGLRARATVVSRQASLAHFMGQDIQALELQSEVLKLAEQLFGPHSSFAIKEYGTLVDELIWQRQFERAQRMLDSAPSINATASNTYAIETLAVERAELELERGDAQKAARSLEPMAKPPSTEHLAPLWLRGRVLCQTNQPLSGLALMREAIRRSVAEGAGEFDPDVALGRSRIGLCAVAAGDRQLAVECAHEARRAFDEEPLVGPRYREALLELESALHIRLGKPSSTDAVQPKQKRQGGTC